MKTVLRSLIALSALLLITGNAMAAGKPIVHFKTSMGDFSVQLEPEKAPKTVANFLQYMRDGHFDGTIFHRVINKFMIQGGGFTTDYQKKPTRAPIENEADIGLPNERGTIAMARTGDPHSATAQFFINTVYNKFLNHTAKNEQGWGYTAFGRVIDGMNIVGRIGRVSTGSGGPFPTDVPQKQVVIEKVTISSN